MARYIDAEEIVRHMCYVSENGSKTDFREVAFWDEIKRMPTADVVEVRHGEWVTLEAEIGLYSCSLCEHKILRAECNYCPNCGAKMDGERKQKNDFKE